MTQTSAEFETTYPTEWHMFDDIYKIEMRQLSLDTYELRSPTHTMILNREGFDLYRDNSMEGQIKFDKWREDNNIEAIEIL